MPGSRRKVQGVLAAGGVDVKAGHHSAVLLAQGQPGSCITESPKVFQCCPLVQVSGEPSAFLSIMCSCLTLLEIHFLLRM